MKKFWWIAGFSALAILSFFLNVQPGSIWQPVFWSMGIAFLFLFGLIRYVIKHAKSAYDRFLGMSMLVLMITLSTYTGYTQYQAAQRQHNLLTDIRRSIDLSTIQAHTKQPLLITLQNYYNQERPYERTLTAIFEEEYGSQIISKNNQPLLLSDGMDKYDEDFPMIIVRKTADADSLVLFGQSPIVNGQDADFINIGGQTGKMQYKATLTEQGVHYERQN